MRRPLLTFALLLLLACGAGLLFQQIAPRSHMLFPPRAANGGDYVLYVHVPDACRHRECDALYLLDGLAWLPTFARRGDDLNERGRVPPLVIIGIGYRNAFDTGNLRKRDFTPAFGRTPQATGGADAFLAVLRNEIIPYAETNLPIAPDRRALAGHSYAGLFAAYALTQGSDLFDRYLIMSPALWFDGRKIFDTPFQPANNTRHVFLAADTPRGATRGEMANDALRFSDLLMQLPNVTVSHALMVGKSHNGMVEPAARLGLDALYGDDAP